MFTCKSSIHKGKPHSTSPCVLLCKSIQTYAPKVYFVPDVFMVKASGISLFKATNALNRRSLLRTSENPCGLIHYPYCTSLLPFHLPVPKGRPNMPRYYPAAVRPFTVTILFLTFSIRSQSHAGQQSLCSPGRVLSGRYMRPLPPCGLSQQSCHQAW